MTFPDLDQARLLDIENAYGIKCSKQAPFSPTDLVSWSCKKNHQWIASAVEVQIDCGCYQCDPGDIEVFGNGTFVLNMAKTLSNIVPDFEQQKFTTHAYLPDAALHIALASFFFSAVRTEFVVKAISKKHSELGLYEKKRFCFQRKGRIYSTVDLVERMYKLGEKNIDKFKIHGLTSKEALEKYKDLKAKVVSYVVARNKIAHGYSKYPLSKKGNYHAEIADLIKSFGQNGLDDVYGSSQNFLNISEKLIDDSTGGISLGNRDCNLNCVSFHI